MLSLVAFLRHKAHIYRSFLIVGGVQSMEEDGSHDTTVAAIILIK